jgi:Na+/H+-translocating membrane pyrophosphatase
MIGPGLLVIFTPLLLGFLFGVKAVSGLIPGAIFSAV